MKIYIASVLAAIAFAQEGTTTEGEGEPAAAEEEEIPEPIVTELAWTSPLDRGQNDTNRDYKYLTATTNPVFLDLAVGGTVTCSTDAEGANTLETAMKGTWNLQWAQTGGSRNNDVYSAGLMTAISESSTRTDESGNTLTDVISEAWAVGGPRDKQDSGNSVTNKGIKMSFIQRTLTAAETRESYEWDQIIDDFAEIAAEGGDSLDAWTPGASQTVEAVAGNRKYMQGIQASASRPFESASSTIQLKNLETYGIWSAVWVVDTRLDKNVVYATGAQDLKIDMPVPEPEPVPCTENDEREECKKEPTGAAGLTFSAIVGAAVLLVAF